MSMNGNIVYESPLEHPIIIKIMQKKGFWKKRLETVTVKLDVVSDKVVIVKTVDGDAEEVIAYIDFELYKGISISNIDLTKVKIVGNYGVRSTGPVSRWKKKCPGDSE